MAIQASRGGCAVMVSGYRGMPRHCEAPVTHAGLVWFPYNRALWLAFACEHHAGQLEAARPLNERDRRELTRRRMKRAAALAGRGPWVPEEPLAVGAAGLRLLERARAWAARHAAG